MSGALADGMGVRRAKAYLSAPETISLMVTEKFLQTLP